MSYIFKRYNFKQINISISADLYFAKKGFGKYSLYTWTE